MDGRMYATENRQQGRVSCTLSVQIHAPSEDVLLFTYAINLSCNGVFVRANRPLPIGTRVHLSLQPNTTKGYRLVVDGLVVRVSGKKGPRGMGLCFVSPNPESQKQLYSLVSRINLRSSSAHKYGPN